MDYSKPNRIEPYYEQVMLDIKTKIIDKIYSPSTQIPSEHKLMEFYGVSRVTIRRAIKELVDDGLLIKRHGIGTFVAPEKQERKIINTVSFAKECRDKGIDVFTKIISKRFVKAGRRDNLVLGIPIGDPVLLIERLRFIKNEPVILERSYFTMNYKWLLEIDDAKLTSLSEVLSAFSKDSKEKEAYIDYNVNISYATEIESYFLKCKKNVPVFFINICTFNNDLQVLNRSEQILVGDKFSITMNVPFQM